MDPIQQLKDEHDNILKFLEIFKSFIEDLESGKNISLDLFKKSIDFLKIYADRLHHGKEEKILFSIIKDHNLNINKGLINEIENEHILGRNSIQKMDLELNKLKYHQIEDYSDLISAFWDYYSLIIPHIEKENLILFPEIIDILSSEILKSVEKSFNYLENKELGVELIQQQLELLLSRK